MNIGLIKEREDDAFVYYRAFLDDVYERQDDGTYACVSKYAIIKYHKKNPHVEYVWNLTDIYFSENKNRADHMLGLILGKMNRCNKAGDFPEETGISTG